MIPDEAVKAASAEQLAAIDKARDDVHKAWAKLARTLGVKDEEATPVISDAAVEAAARVHQDLLAKRGHPNWDELGKFGVQGQRLRLDWMAAALEAAAPHLMAAAESVADLDGMPVGSVVMGFDEYGEQLVSRKSEHGTWEQAGTDDGWQAEGIIREYGTVTVLHRGSHGDD